MPYWSNVAAGESVVLTMPYFDCLYVSGRDFRHEPFSSRRAELERLAKEVPNVKQVVNELEVKNQKATSTN